MENAFVVKGTFRDEYNILLSESIDSLYGEEVEVIIRPVHRKRNTSRDLLNSEEKNLAMLKKYVNDNLSSIIKEITGILKYDVDVEQEKQNYKEYLIGKYL